MTALYILLGLAAFIALVACLRLTLVLRLEEEFSLSARILCFRIPLFPKKEKPLRPSRFRIKAFRRWRLKEEKQFRKKALAKAAADRKKEEKKKADEALKDGIQKKSWRDNATFGVDLVRHVILRAVGTFGRHLRIHVYRFEITVAGEDPAKTAVAFGCVCQAVAYLKEWLERTVKLRYAKGSATPVAVHVDYLSPRPRYAVHLALHLRVWQLLAVALDALKGYLTMPKRESQTKPVTTGENKTDTPSASGTPGSDTHSSQENAPQRAGEEVSL